MTENELKELASQLSFPKGENGIEVGKIMHATNISMTTDAIEALEIRDNDSILELGHGNCGHLIHILDKGNATRYQGLEVSELMQQEAIRSHSNTVDNNQASFDLYDGKSIPFPENAFEKIMTVNTVYFWEKPQELLKEIYRVLKPGGLFCIVFAEEHSMKKLPFTQYGFRLYSTDKLEQLISNTNFRKTRIQKKTETIQTKTGETAERDYTVLLLGKE